jgi:hypothetical protein
MSPRRDTPPEFGTSAIAAPVVRYTLTAEMP